ncbi:MAG: hypothetical protein RL226_30 [Bacteroidota bacterium]
MSKTEAEQLASVYSDQPERIQELIDLIRTNTYPIANKAAWVVRRIAEKKPQLILPYFDYLVEFGHSATHQGVRRECFKAAIEAKSQVSVDSDQAGRLLQLAFKSMECQQSICEQFYAMEVLDYYIKPFPELKEEYIALLRLNSHWGTAASKKRMLKRIVELE